MTKIKICCIQNEQEIKMVSSAGVDAIGFVGPMPSGIGPISLEQIAQLFRSKPKDLNGFFLTSSVDFNALENEFTVVQPDTVQLVDKTESRVIQQLKNRFPDLDIVQVIHVVDNSAIDEAIEIEPFVDAILLDSGNPNKAIKELGGTGRTHNWQVSKDLVARVNIPVYLAGGLHPENVSEAIQLVKPFGVDICSRLRNGVNLDPDKLNRFVAAVRNSL